MNRKTALTLIEIVTGFLFLVSIPLLFFRPDNNFVRLDLLGFLLLFMTAFLISFLCQPRLISSRNILVVGLMLSGLILVTAAVQPTSKTHGNSVQVTVSRKKAIIEGMNVAKVVEAGSLSHQEAEEFLGQTIKEGVLLDLAKQSLSLSLDGDKQAIKDLVPTVPVKKYQWTCNDLGCSYADRTNIWTIANSTRTIATLVGFIAVGSLIWLTYSEPNDE